MSRDDDYAAWNWITWITTWSFWNTQSQWVRPLMLTEVPSEQTMRERRNRARMAPTSLSKQGCARCSMASSAPSPILRANRRWNNRVSRWYQMPWVKRR